MQTIITSNTLNIIYKRLALQIAEYAGEESIAVVGIQSRGVEVAKKIEEQLKKLNCNYNFGTVDISFYRDDYKNKIHFGDQTQLPFKIDDKKIVLIDDVLYTGRTIRAAMDALMDFGRAKEIVLCALVDRKYNRELPISPNFVGLTIDTFITQKVKVNVANQTVVLYD